MIDGALSALFHNTLTHETTTKHYVIVAAGFSSTRLEVDNLNVSQAVIGSKFSTLYATTVECKDMAP
jgi:hypothetical protein